jgi:Peptidase propeptide and YPEB domain
MRAGGLFFAASLLLAGCSSDDFTTAGNAGQAGPNAGVQTGTAVLEEDSPGLLAQATISDAAARAVALERFPGSQIVDADIDQDDGRIIYQYELRVANVRHDVDIDAKTGSIVAVDDEDVNDANGPAKRDGGSRLDTKHAPSAPVGPLRPARPRPRMYIAAAPSLSVAAPSVHSMD